MCTTLTIIYNHIILKLTKPANVVYSSIFMNESFKQFAINLATNAHVLFILIALPAIVLFLGVLPPAWGLDEQVHTARSYQVSEGNWYPDKLVGEGRFGGKIPTSLEAALSHGHTVSNSVSRNESFLDRKDETNPVLTAKIDSQPINSALVEYDFGPTGPYAPVAYLPSAFGIGIGRIFDLSVGNTVLFARSMQAIFFVAITAFALWVLRSTKVKWIAFVVALLPATIYQAVTINADAYTIAISLLFMAIIYRLFVMKKRADVRWITLLSVGAGLLVFTKPSYALLLGLIAFIPWGVFGTKKRSLLVKASILVGSVLLLALVSIKGLGYGDSILLYRDPITAASISLTDQILYILSHPFDFISVLIGSIVRYSENWGTSIVGLLGYNTISTPYILMILAYISLFMSGMYSKAITHKQAWAILVIVLISMLSVIVLLYGTFNMVGASVVSGVQGRYFIPCIPLLLLAIGKLLPLRIAATDRSIAGIHSILSVLILYGTCFAYVVAFV